MSRYWKLRILAILCGLLAGGGLAAIVLGAYRLIGPSALGRAAAGFDAMYRAVPASTKKLLDATGYAPGARLICPANFDGALVFSGDVMERQPQRGYRFRPGQSNLWVFPPGLPNQILVPDTDAARALLDEAKIPVTSREEINSYGCRGPDWDEPKSYDFRVLVVGDSFTEGILVDTEQTFCNRLQSHLQSLGAVQALVANAGVIGYSTEQEFYTMCELAPQLRPDIVVLCFYANDVHHDHQRVLQLQRSKGDWETAKTWLDRCVSYCRSNGIHFAVAVIPDRSQAQSGAGRKSYQQRVEQIAFELGIYLIDPHERFLSHRQDALYLQGDAHLAPAGHELLARVLADHIQLWMPKKELK